MTDSPEPKCPAKSDRGFPCQAPPQTGSPFCFFHDPATAEARAAARQAGGRERAKRPSLAPDSQDLPLSTVREVTSLLGDTINRVRKGQLDVRIANTVGYLAGVLMKSIEVGELEARLDRLEGTVMHTKHEEDPVFDRALVLDEPPQLNPGALHEEL